MTRALRHGVATAVAMLAACGARSSLEVEDAVTSGSGGAQVSISVGPGAGGMGGATTSVTSVTSVTSTTAVTTAVTTVSTTSGPPCTSDEECADDVGCTVDLCTPSGCTNVPDASLCDDGLVCTVDTCDGSLDCQHGHTDAGCDDGLGCTIDSCDDATDSCVNAPCDGLCDDGTFCDGVERCDSALGCVQGAPSCDLDQACAQSSCNESSDTCKHTFPMGCVQPDVHLLVTDAVGRLWDLSPLGNPTAQIIANPGGTVHLDIAVLDGRWFVMDQFLRELYPGTNMVKADISPLQLNSLGGGPDHMLYAAGTQVFRIDPNSGMSTYLGDLPTGHSSSGDIAFLGDRLFVSTDSPCGGALVEFDPLTGTSTVMGGDGLGCVYGLANVGGVLYIVNCDGKIGTFDPDTGEVRIFATTTVQAYGADALP